MFYEANKQNEIIKWIYMKVLWCIQQIHFHNTIVKQEHFYLIFINGNISYEGILKNRKYRCDSLCGVFFFYYLPWIVTRALPVNRFHSKSFYDLRDIIIYHLTFLWFLFMWSFWRQFFPSHLDLSIVQASLQSPMLVDTVSRDVTKVNTYF